MTTPKEPAKPGTGESPAGTTGAAETGARRPAARPGGARITDSGEPPPWQRGQSTASTQQRPTPRSGEAGHAAESTGAHEAHPGGYEAQTGGHSPGVDARLRRFVAGGAPAPGAAAPAGAAGGQTGPAKRPAQPGAEGPNGGAPVKAAPAKAVPAKPPVKAPGDSDTTRAEKAASDAYGSELPDLSGPPRSGPRKPPAPRVRSASKPRGPVRASMQIRRIDPWSTLKVSLLLSVSLFFVWMIAVAMLYLLLGAMGVWSKLNSNVGELLNSNNSAAELVSSGSIFGGAALIGLVNIVILTAMATLGAIVYNLSTDVVGGIEVTLADRD